MSEKNVFAEEWRDCLREHYKHVVRHDTQITRRSLEHVLLSGDAPIFSESELKQLYIEATMRAEDMPDDFVPEMVYEQLENAPAPAVAEEVPVNPAHPLECQCPACVEINLIPHDSEGQPLDEEALAELHEELSARRNDEDAPTQLSLF